MSISIGRGGKAKLCVGQLPGRKRPSLYLWTAMDIRTLASFKSQAAADEAVSFLESMIGGKIIDADLSEEPKDGE